jgi:hypothetical protein
MGVGLLRLAGLRFAAWAWSVGAVGLPPFFFLPVREHFRPQAAIGTPRVAR